MFLFFSRFFCHFVSGSFAHSKIYFCEYVALKKRIFVCSEENFRKHFTTCSSPVLQLQLILELMFSKFFSLQLLIYKISVSYTHLTLPTKA